MIPAGGRRLIFSGIKSYYTIKNVAKPESDIARQLQAKIKLSGPITVAEFMKEALTNPVSGYYTRNDMFGEDGDFVTSPELGQLFGEMVAVWFLNEWTKAGSPKPFQIVELGPGRGSLCQDILRVFDHFKALNEASVRLVEVSPLLSSIQAQKLCINSSNVTDELTYRQGVSHYGIPITWHRHLKDLPNSFTLLVAHEFFDALPIHKFQNTDKGYREILIDIDTTKELAFRYVLAREQTPASKILIKGDETREHFEISPQSIIITKEIAERLENHGGLALIADYGHDGTGTDTFRAYKKHKQQNPLIDVGNADLTADVDFLNLKTVAIETGGVMAFGPIAQRDFLHQMGIEYRVNKLKESIKEEQTKTVEFGYHMMTDEDKMGTKFKFLSLLPSTLSKIIERYPVVGFDTNTS